MNESPKDDNSKANAATNMTARSKVMQNWSSSWNTITPVPAMPAEESRVSSRRKSSSKTSAYNDNNVKIVKKTKEITPLLNAKYSAKQNEKRNKPKKDNSINANNKSSNENESNSKENDIKSDNNHNSDSAPIYKNLRKRKSTEVTDEDRMSTNSNNSNNESEQTGNKVLEVVLESDIIGDKTMSDNNNIDTHDINDISAVSLPSLPSISFANNPVCVTTNTDMDCSSTVEEVESIATVSKPACVVCGMDVAKHVVLENRFCSRQCAITQWTLEFKLKWSKDSS